MRWKCNLWIAALGFMLLLPSRGFTQHDSLETVAAPATQLPPIFSASLGLQHGFIFAHSPEVENTKGSHPTGVEMTLSWQRSDAATWNLCNCYPRKGLLLAYYDYDNIILGKSFTAAYFLEPLYRLRKNMFFAFKASAGLSWLTNPFDSVSNPSNRSYSTHTSIYLRLGTGLWFRLGDRWALNTSINYQHESNGGRKQPNKGINWPTAGFALAYDVNPRAFYAGPRRKDKYWKELPIRWDAGIFALAKRSLDEEGNSRRLPMVGLMLQASKQVGTISGLLLTAEVYHDESLRIRLAQDSIPASALKAGVSAGHEFILGKFLFSQRLGFYLFDQTPYFDNVFHRWGLQYRISKNWSAGFNLQAHRHVADFIDLRLVYSLQ